MAPLLLPEVHTHPSPRLTLLPHLLPLLPYGLPLVRRLQFHFQSPHAHVLCTIAPNTPPPHSRTTTQEPPTPFAALYLDRSRAPETECWLFSTLELPAALQPASPPQSETHALPHLLALLSHISTLPLPASYPTTQSSSLLLLGSVHRSVLQALVGAPIPPHAGRKVISGPSAQAGSTHSGNTADGTSRADRVHGEWRGSSATRGGCVRGHTVPYRKYLFRPATIARTTAEDRAGDGVLEGLGLEWTTVREGEFELVASRTEIPRSGRTMRLLGSVGLRRKAGVRRNGGHEGGEDGQLVAWAFLGPDGSLTSLHVEPECRGKGLGKLVTRRLFGLLAQRGETSGFGDVRVGEEWCHSDVAADNAGSIGVARGLGGEEGWECFWGWVDLGEVGRRVVSDEGW
ncbi:hypothetical protein MMC18_006949 [Xylographa bjoerkii]|nr:hypothetical protein [Xylographa bjoerkii]